MSLAWLPFASSQLLTEIVLLCLLQVAKNGGKKKKASSDQSDDEFSSPSDEESDEFSDEEVVLENVTEIEGHYLCKRERYKGELLLQFYWTDEQGDKRASKRDRIPCDSTRDSSSGTNATVPHDSSDETEESPTHNP